jgi:hypothetical protein
VPAVDSGKVATASNHAVGVCAPPKGVMQIKEVGLSGGGSAGASKPWPLQMRSWASALCKEMLPKERDAWTRQASRSSGQSLPAGQSPAGPSAGFLDEHHLAGACLLMSWQRGCRLT